MEWAGTVFMTNGGLLHFRVVSLVIAVSANGRKCVRNPDIQVLVSCHVETVALLSKKK